MIIFFDGNSGSGKTYEAVKKIIDNLRRGRKVYTNIDGLGLRSVKRPLKLFIISVITIYSATWRSWMRPV